jgi:hypothetical protein
MDCDQKKRRREEEETCWRMRTNRRSAKTTREESLEAGESIELGGRETTKHCSKGTERKREVMLTEARKICIELKYEEEQHFSEKCSKIVTKPKVECKVAQTCSVPTNRNKEK